MHMRVFNHAASIHFFTALEVSHFHEFETESYETRVFTKIGTIYRAARISFLLEITMKKSEKREKVTLKLLL